MRAHLSLILPLLLPAAAFAGEKCDALRAEFEVVASSEPAQCAEAASLHARFRKSFPDFLRECERVEAQATADAPSARAVSLEALERQFQEARRHLRDEKSRLQLRVGDELLFVPGLPPLDEPQLSTCRNELEPLLVLRQHALATISRLFSDREDTLEAEKQLQKDALVGAGNG